MTDQGKCFESALFHSFCNIFRIHKIRTYGYRPQCNGICKRFNQSLKHSLRKLLSKPQQSNWDLYLTFVVFTNNTSVHTSTGFKPQFLTFGAETRLPADLAFVASDPDALEQLANVHDGHGYTAGLHTLFKSFSNLHSVFESVRTNLESFHQREKERDNLGAVERGFRPGDMVKIRLTSRQPGPSKFKSEWSGPHQVVRVRVVVVTVKEVSTGREYNTHHDRLSNHIFSKKFAPGTTARPGVLPRGLPGTHANPRENPEEPEEDLHPVADPAIALQRSRQGSVLRPRRDPNFDYSSSFLDSVLPLHASTFSARDHSFALFAASLPSHTNSG